MAFTDLKDKYAKFSDCDAYHRFTMYFKRPKQQG